MNVWRPSLGTGLVLGLGIFLLGVALQVLLLNLLYRKPISKYSVGEEMRRYM